MISKKVKMSKDKEIKLLIKFQDWNATEKETFKFLSLQNDICK